MTEHSLTAKGQPVKSGPPPDPDPEQLEAVLAILRASYHGHLAADGTEVSHRCPTPSHPDTHPSASTSTSTGLWQCMACGARGNLLQLTRMLYEQGHHCLLPWLRSNGVKPTSKALASWAASRHLDPAYLAEVWGVRASRYRDRPQLTYPTPRGVSRAKYTDGQQPKVVWMGKLSGDPEGCLYGLEQALLLLSRQAAPVLYLVNGEPSVWAAQQAGVPAICLCLGETPAKARATQHWLQQLAASKAAQVPLRVVYDADSTGRAGAAMAVQQALSVGLEDVQALDLAQYPWPTEVPPGADVDNLHQVVAEGLADVLATLPVLEQPPVDLLTGLQPQAEQWHSQLVAAGQWADAVPTTWVVQGLVPAGGSVLMYGQPKHGKSLLALDWSARAAQHGLVVYVVAEGQQGFSTRLAAWQAHRPGVDLGYLYCWRGPVQLLDPTGWQAFVATCSRLADHLEQPLRLVVLDTLSRCLMGQDENDQGTAGAALGAVAHLQDLGAAVVLVHHPDKQGKGPRGSSVFLGGVDAILRVDARGTKHQVTTQKQKDGAEAGPRLYHRVVVSLEATEGVTVTEAAADEPLLARSDRGVTKARRQLLQAVLLLLEAGDPEPLQWSAIRSAAEPMAERTYSDSLAWAVQQGYLLPTTGGYQLGPTEWPTQE